MGISTFEQLRFKRRTSHVPVNFQSPHFAVQNVRAYIMNGQVFQSSLQNVYLHVLGQTLSLPFLLNCM